MTKNFTWFHTIMFIPCDKKCGKGDGSSAGSVDLSRRDFWAMMYYDCCQGNFFQERFQSLKHCFGDQSPSKATVFRWFRRFISGASTLEDEDRCGQMAMTVTPENVSRVESLIKKDPKNGIHWNTGYHENFTGKSHSYSSRLPWCKETLCLLGAA